MWVNGRVEFRGTGRASSEENFEYAGECRSLRCVILCFCVVLCGVVRVEDLIVVLKGSLPDNFCGKDLCGCRDLLH